MVLVIEANSSNSRALVDTARAAGKDAYLIDDAAEAPRGAGGQGCRARHRRALQARLAPVDALLDPRRADFGGAVETRTHRRGRHRVQRWSLKSLALTVVG